MLTLRTKIILLISLVLTAFTFAAAYSPVSTFDQSQKVPKIQSRHWINSDPLSWKELQGKVAMVEFWTFECYNCKNVEPYIKQWYKKFHDKGFEIIAVHSPEFSHERKIENVEKYTRENAITYPVAIDNDFRNWKRFSNRYWPAMYLVDKKGFIRYRFIGEGNYEQIEQKIKQLLSES